VGIFSKSQTWFARLNERLRNLGPEPRPPVVEVGESGFKLSIFRQDGSIQTIELKWQDIQQAVAYKRDVFAYDLICIEFITAEWGVEINERMEGWGEMTSALPNYLPGITDCWEWWNAILQPPFAANPTVIFKRYVLGSQSQDS